MAEVHFEITSRPVRSEILGNERIVHVLAPREGGPYPTVYMQDGQDLFGMTAGPCRKSWELDFLVDELVTRGVIPPLVLVAVTSTESRLDEYTPTHDWYHQGGGGADDYMRFLCEELKPAVDRAFPVRTEREATVIGGSSLGGLLALYGGLAHSETIGNVVALSPSVWWDDGAVCGKICEGGADPDGVRLWMDVGLHELESLPDDPIFKGAGPIELWRCMNEALCHLGFAPGPGYRYYEDPEGSHDLASWGCRMAEALTFLFGAGL